MTINVGGNIIFNMLELESSPKTEEEILLKAEEIVTDIRNVVTLMAPLQEATTFHYDLGSKKILHYQDISKGDTLAELLTREPDPYLVRMGQEKPEANPDIPKINIEIARIMLGSNARFLDLPPEALVNRTLPDGIKSEVSEYGYRKSYDFSFPTIIRGLNYTAEILNSSETILIRHKLSLTPNTSK